MLIDGYVAEQIKNAMLNSEQEQVKVVDMGTSDTTEREEHYKEEMLKAEITDNMDREAWHKIFKKHLQNYHAIHGLASTNIIDKEEKHRLLEKLLDDIMTTFDSEVNE